MPDSHDSFSAEDHSEWCRSVLPLLEFFATVALLLTMEGCRPSSPRGSGVAKMASVAPARVIVEGSALENVAWTADGRHAALVRVNAQRRFSVLSMETDERAVLTAEYGNPTVLALSRKGDRVAVGCRGGVEVWDLASRTILCKLPHDRLHSAAVGFSPRGDYVYAATTDPEAALRQLNLVSGEVDTLYRAADDTHLPSTFGFTISTLAISEDSRTLAIGVSGGTIVFDLPSRTVRFAIKSASGPPTRTVFSPDGKVLATARETIELWESETGTRRVVIPTSLVVGLAFSADQKLLASAGDGVIDRPGHIDIWQVKDGKLLVSFTCHKDALLGVSFLRDTRSVLSGSIDGTVCRWDLTRLPEFLQSSRDD